MKNCLKRRNIQRIQGYIPNFIQHYSVEANSSVDELLGANSVDFSGTAQILIIYTAFMKNNEIQRRNSSAIYRHQQNSFSVLMEIVCNILPKISTLMKLLMFIKCF
jgi:hypothetical protein